MLTKLLTNGLASGTMPKAYSMFRRWRCSYCISNRGLRPILKHEASSNSSRTPWCVTTTPPTTEIFCFSQKTSYTIPPHSEKGIVNHGRPHRWSGTRKRGHRHVRCQDRRFSRNSELLRNMPARHPRVEPKALVCFAHTQQPNVAQPMR
jgi:hypothetical protein